MARGGRGRGKRFGPSSKDKNAPKINYEPQPLYPDLTKPATPLTLTRSAESLITLYNNLTANSLHNPPPAPARMPFPNRVSKHGSSRAATAAASYDPFNGMKTYTSRYSQKARNRSTGIAKRKQQPLYTATFTTGPHLERRRALLAAINPSLTVEDVNEKVKSVSVSVSEHPADLQGVGYWWWSVPPDFVDEGAVEKSRVSRGQENEKVKRKKRVVDDDDDLDDLEAKEKVDDEEGDDGEKDEDKEDEHAVTSEEEEEPEPAADEEDDSYGNGDDSEVEGRRKTKRKNPKGGKTGGEGDDLEPEENEQIFEEDPDDDGEPDRDDYNAEQYFDNGEEDDLGGFEDGGGDGGFGDYE